MTKRSTKHSLIMSALSLLLCASMLIGTTFAWFTDSVTSTNNIIQSGTLDVDLKYSTDMTTWNEVKDTTDLFSGCLWEPGFTKVIYLRVANIGTLALKYNLGINVASETPGTLADGSTFNLSDYIYFDVIEGVTTRFIDRAAARAAATEGVAIKAGYAKGGSLVAKTASHTDFPADTVALVVYMPETVGNEANYHGTQPVVNLGINLFATQVESETDSFDRYYDKEADIIGTDTEIIVPGSNVSSYEFEINNKDNTGKLATALVPALAVADDAEKVSVSVYKTTYKGNFTIATGMESTAFDVSVEGLKDNNDVPVKVQLRIAAGLDPATVVLYHYDEKIVSTYNPSTGYVTFETPTFSPFTIVFDAESEYVPPVIPDVEKPDNPPADPDDEEKPDGLPVANVVESPEFENVDLPWGSYGPWSPTQGLDSHLEAAYTFSCTDTLEEAIASPFANWHCDFYVKLDKDLGENQIFLGGNYGAFGWVGFHNGNLTLEANTEIPLLGSVTNNPWTYTNVVQSVGTFICGVGDVDDALADATFTVILRLTNPDNAEHYYDISTITHTFTKTVTNG